ncbi:unnamed protein product, partial [Vitis vinifera]
MTILLFFLCTKYCFGKLFQNCPFVFPINSHHGLHVSSHGRACGGSLNRGILWVADLHAATDKLRTSPIPSLDIVGVFLTLRSEYMM